MDFSGFSRDINSAVKDAVFGSPSLDDIKLSDEGRTNGNANSSANMGANGSTGANASGYEWQTDPFGWQTGSFSGQTDPFMDLAGRAARDQGSANIPVCKRPKGLISGRVMTAAGICGAVGFGGAAIVSLAAGAVFAGAVSATVLTPGIVFAVITAAAVFVAARGTGLRKRAARFREYLRTMGQNEFCSIKEIAEKCGRAVSSVTKDLKKMIKLGMFREGHIDDSEQWFIANDKTYDQYLQARDDFKNRQTEERETERRTANETDDERKLRQALERGKQSIAEIDRARAEITGETVRTELDDIEVLIRKIFDRVKEKPSLLPDIKKFMDYYLPTTVKLVSVYSEFEKKSVQSEDVVAAKHEIEQTLGTIEKAFGRLLEELYQDTVMDVSTDISVLNAMFARDGLTGGDFDDPGPARGDGGK